MNNLFPVILTIAPELSRWLFGAGGDAPALAVTQAVQGVIGTIDPEAVTVALQQNAALTMQLRVRLGQLAADWEKSQRAADMEKLGDVIRNAVPDPTAKLAQSPDATWAAQGISAAVLAVFTLMMSLIMFRGMPPGAETAVNLLLGTLAAMATSVVSYWVGSSAGSARKDDRLAQLNK